MKSNMRIELKYAIGLVLIVATIGILWRSCKSPVPHISVATCSQHTNIIPVAIIGSGPAGLTAALYTARAHLPTVVFTGDDLGGQLTEARFVENWPAKKKESGAQIMKEIENQVRFFGAHIVSDSVVKADFSQWPYSLWLGNGDCVKALSIVIATGGTQQKLDIPGVKEYWGKGIGICTICDAPFDKGKNVAIIGSTDFMCDMALQLKEFAKHITVLVPDEYMHAAAVNRQYLEESKNITICYASDVTKIFGENGRLSGIEVRDKKKNTVENLPVQSFYFAMGFKPKTELFNGQINLDKQGFIKVYNRCKKTSMPLIYAAGTVIDPLYQKGLVSASMGAQAAIRLIEEMQESGFTDQIMKELEPCLYKAPEEPDLIEKITEIAALKDLIAGNKPVLVDFYGNNCPTCKHMLPVLKEVARRMKDQVKVVKFDIQEEHDVIDLFAIELIPTFILFVQGKEVARSIGAMNMEAFLEFINTHAKI